MRKMYTVWTIRALNGRTKFLGAANRDRAKVMRGRIYADPSQLDKLAFDGMVETDGEEPEGWGEP